MIFAWQQVTGQLADTPTRGLDDSRTGHLAYLSTRGLDNSRTGQVADWTTRGCHRRLCVLSFRSFGGICETASCPVRDLSSPRVGNPRVGVSASCPVTAQHCAASDELCGVVSNLDRVGLPFRTRAALTNGAVPADGAAARAGFCPPSCSRPPVDPSSRPVVMTAARRRSERRRRRDITEMY